MTTRQPWQPGESTPPLRPPRSPYPTQENAAIPIQAHVGNTPFYPVEVYNGKLGPDRTAALSQAGNMIDRTPKIFRRYTNLGYLDVQLRNGLGRGVGSGYQFPYFDQMFVWAFIPRIPGQTRGDVAGFKKRAGSAYNFQDWAQNGPGSQPEHPGGPGQIAGSNVIYNPMSGLGGKTWHITAHIR